MRKTLKWIGIVLGSLVGLVFVFAAVMMVRGSAKINATYDVQPATVTIPDDPAAIERGKYLFTATCAGCHGVDLSEGERQ